MSLNLKGCNETDEQGEDGQMMNADPSTKVRASPQFTCRTGVVPVEHRRINSVSHRVMGNIIYTKYRSHKATCRVSHTDIPAVGYEYVRFESYRISIIIRYSAVAWRLISHIMELSQGCTKTLHSGFFKALGVRKLLRIELVLLGLFRDIVGKLS